MDKKAVQRNPGEGYKSDGDKDPLHLMPVDAEQAIARVLRFGMRKYAARNWEHGMDWSRLYRASRQHLAAFWAGEDLDPESGEYHMAHAACCVMFLLSYQQRGMTQFDDRPREFFGMPAMEKPAEVPEEDFSELEGILDEVEEFLSYAPRVGMDRERKARLQERLQRFRNGDD